MEPAEGSAKSRPPCDLCGGTGEMTWLQPEPEDGGYVLREVGHPCTNGCSGWWRVPAAERGDSVGWAAEANVGLGEL
ncbi:hypothetical protein CLV43_10490 [Umezawaea tangerina]|uniref:Uncharacterized protein n=1 Tax=Umezawaea tangerina TaxID=84725 RepID=A0A2T0T9D2_9PSEU|nr:hypothetical protein CLV43_10490 [Umezawaea tangerina]